MKVWDVTTAKEILAWKSTGHGRVFSVAFSPDGRRLASGGDDGVKVRDATTGQETTALKGATNTVLSVVFSPDGKRLAAGNGSALKVWNVTTGKQEVTLMGQG